MPCTVLSFAVGVYERGWACLCTQAEARERHWLFYSIILCLIPLTEDLSLSLGLAIFASVASQQAPVHLLSPKVRCTGEWAHVQSDPGCLLVCTLEAQTQVVMIAQLALLCTEPSAQL